MRSKMNLAYQQPLSQWAADIIPSNEMSTKANVYADEIFKLIQRESKFKVGRVCISGSVGKKTTTKDSDIDLVLFINNERPPFEDALYEWKNILNQFADVRKTKYSIQFKAWDFEFDILPAANFTPGDASIDLQRQRVLAHIAKDPKKYGYSYSSSLTDASMRFMAQQSSFVHEMARIGKYWYKTLHFNEYVSGAKTCIELIAVHVAIQEEQLDEISYLRCFKRFIKYLRNFDELNVQTVHFKKKQCAVDKSRPRVIDPVNPYNNFARNWDPKSIEWIKYYANETKRRLDFLGSHGLIDLRLLFEPQSMHHHEISNLNIRNDAITTQIVHCGWVWNM